MKILRIHPPPPSGNAVGFVDVEPAEGVRLYKVRIARGDDGTFRVRARGCSFSRAVIAQIADATLNELALTSSRSNEHITSH